MSRLQKKRNQTIFFFQERNDSLCSLSSTFLFLLLSRHKSHLATRDRRVRALRELARILRVGGRILITVWAKEQRHRKVSPSHPRSFLIFISQVRLLYQYIEKEKKGQNSLIPRLRKKKKKIQVEKGGAGLEAATCWLSISGRPKNFDTPPPRQKSFDRIDYQVFERGIFSSPEREREREKTYPAADGGNRPWRRRFIYKERKRVTWLCAAHVRGRRINSFVKALFCPSCLRPAHTPLYTSTHFSSFVASSSTNNKAEAAAAILLK